MSESFISASTLAAHKGIRHGFFTRQGGVSDGIYASLNCGLGSRDAPANIGENRARVAAHLGVPPERLLSCYQQHSARAVVVEEPFAPEAMPQADALVTRTPGLAVGVLTADCAPVLFCDAHAGVVAAAHAGWRGAVSGILDATIGAMVQLGATRDRISAAIGPTISQQAYEVGDDYAQGVIAEDADARVYFIKDAGSGRQHFDLPSYVAARLARAGLSQIADLGLCTYSEPDRLFSYRRSQHRGEADYGRQISAIVLT